MLSACALEKNIIKAARDDKKNLNMFFIFPLLNNYNSRVKKKNFPEKLIREIVELFKNSLWKKRNSNDNQS